MSINYVCSLGSLCQSASIIKENNLRLCSYPFDWVFSNNNIVLECIEEDFKNFLDKSYYTDIGHKWNDNQCGHKIYGCNFFNHKDPRKDCDYQYYIRCINRFKNVLKSSLNKLFILTITNINENDDEIIKNNVIDFNNKFCNYTNNYILLVIYNKKNEIQKHNFTYNNNIHFLELNTLSYSNGEKFIDNSDNLYLNNLIKSTYQFNLTSH